MHTILLDALHQPQSAGYQGAVHQAAELLAQGELVAFPTETVYGLGARVFDAEQVQKIFRAKMRPQDNPLIAHIASMEDAYRLTPTLPDVALRLMESFFPGPLTLVLPKHPDVPSVVSAGLDSIAFRMPAHPVALALIRAVGQPLVAPSANLSGKPSPTTAAHVMQDMNGRIAAVLDGGACVLGIESTVLSLLEDTPRILRPGTIGVEEIEAIIEQPLDKAAYPEHGVAHSPGMKYRHYAPLAALRIAYNWEDIPADAACILASANPLHLPSVRPLSIQNFYAELRRADEVGIKEIVVLLSKDIQQQPGLLNRIMKAAE